MADFAGYTIKKGVPQGGASAVKRLLEQSYWANDRPLETVERSLANSDCFGAYCADELVGFARVITDRATTFYICDVIVDEAHRSRGIGKALIKAITDAADYDGMVGLLITGNANGLYEKYGFKRDENKAMYRPRKPLEEGR